MASKRNSSSETSCEESASKRQRPSRESSQVSIDDENMLRARSHSRRRRRLRVAASNSFDRPINYLTLDEEEVKSEEDELLTRIYTAIDYTQSRLRENLRLMQTTRFTVPLPTKTYTLSGTEESALRLLRSGPATRVLTAPDFEVFEFCIPIQYPNSVYGLRRRCRPQHPRCPLVDW